MFCVSIYLWILLGDSSLSFAQEAVIIDSDGKVRSADTKSNPPAYTSPLINVDFYKADIHSVMRFFANVGGKNIILAEGVEGTVTIRMKNVHWEEAFLAVLWSKGLQAQSMENMLMVR